MDHIGDIHRFKLVMAVVEHGGIRAAANALNISQPSITRQVNEFQNHYNLRVFRNARGRRHELTNVGLAFPAFARDLVETRDRAIEVLQAIQEGEVSSLHLGCSPFVDRFICERAMQLQTSFLPSSKVHLSTADTAELVSEVLEGKLDAAIVTLPVSDERVRIDLIHRDRLVVCLPEDHLLAHKPSLSAHDLQENLTIFRQPSQHPEAHERLVEMLAELGVGVEEHARSSHPLGMQEAIRSGHGFGLLREGTPLMQGLTTRPIAGAKWTVDTAFIYRAESASPLVRVIGKNLRRQFLRQEPMFPPKKAPSTAKDSGRPKQMKLIR